MARLLARKKHKRAEPTIALINVVFLLLIFFLIAGTLNQSVDKDVDLITISDAVDSLPEDVLAMRSDGRFFQAGEAVQIEDILPQIDDENAVLRIAPDRELPAEIFVVNLAILKDAGWREIKIIGEKAQ